MIVNSSSPVIKYCDLDAFFFPVGLHNIYFDKDKGMKPIPTPREPQFARDFKAVVDEEYWELLSCVSPSYTLITNEWAYETGLEIARTIFNAKDNEISFWHGELTEKRGACYMDIRVHKSLTISGVENHWFAFVRVKNSYDKSCSLAYEIGFCLETMDERQVPLGLLVPSLSLHFAANHIWMLKTIQKKLWEAVYSKYHHLNVFAEFERMVRDLLSIEVVDDEILPLFCRLAKLHKLDPTSEADRKLAYIVMQIEKDSDYWIKKCGPNAYAALCAYADFASKYAKEVRFLDKPSEFQSQLGKFVDELLESKQKEKELFSLDEFIGKHAREVKKQIKLMCS